MTEINQYRLDGLDCADCALHVEKGVSKLPGVDSARVDFATATLRVEGSAQADAVRQRVQDLGYRMAEPTASLSPGLPKSRTRENFWHYLLERSETRLALIAGGLILFSLLLGWLGLDARVAAGIQIAALIIAGYPIARDAVNNLRINHDFNINFLMSLAAVGAVIIGETTEAAVLIFLFTISEALEGYTTERSRRALTGLTELAPREALRLRAGREEVVPVVELVIGDRLLIRPGERVPMDGVVVSGESQVNQAPVTGESLPVEKIPGGAVFAGSINGTGGLEIEVTHLAEDNTLSRILHLVEQAQAQRAPTQRIIDQFAHYYTPAVVVLAILIAAVPPLFFGQPFLNPAAGERGWLYRALSLLVISCPCALVVSAPVTILSAISAAARGGVLVKGGAFMEALSKVKVFAFDKTGTLTRGQPVVMLHQAADCPNGSDCANCDQVLALASALERRSTHPLAGAVVRAAQERGLDEVYSPAQNVAALAGAGLTGEVDADLVTIGRHEYFETAFPHTEVLCGKVQAAEALGQTAMLVANNADVRGFIAVADEVRPESAQVVAALKALGARTALLSGDNQTVAQAVGARVGIDTVRASLLPDEKLAAIHELQAAYGPTAMVGDGINDTPALAAASVGIAMGGAGSAQALEAADIVLMADGLKQLPGVVRLAKFTRSIIWQNVIFSVGVKLAFVALALTGGISLWLAVLADTGLSLLVTANGTRPAWKKIIAD